MLWVGDKGCEIYSMWEPEADEAKKLNTYYTKFEAYVKPKLNRVFARNKFHQKVQQEGESFEQFLTDLKLLVKDCGYADPDDDTYMTSEMSCMCHSLCHSHVTIIYADVLHAIETCTKTRQRTT